MVAKPMVAAAYCAVMAMPTQERLEWRTSWTKKGRSVPATPVSEERAPSI